ncbi:2-C-methyl-D-erythritol 4-phosphate cytidylyltransferase [Pontibacter sp. G13]|uniref:2-C-methyl-D-erythritol 4-phosphate cytidylyltransferase n=1 Tax=Pontibacter sp. G13 TaxID=3074898 RepID=UPI00288B3206|nr:2-C-methyl-D-erythritol 4-phosphate cytidylyltransferase [Pontibacter sp. G13]WNJ18904.1 2-C-methyl-D-erythritol 4-phosphate cytidylyltransferase [Pontibacter sp. G13]
MPQKRAAIIVAGGSGTRMGAEIPKQFLPIAGTPILILTAKRFLEFDSEMPIVLVLPTSSFEYWNEVSREFLSEEDAMRIVVAAGGTTRTESVHNGLETLMGHIPSTEDYAVGIHDGVRPFISVEHLAGVFGRVEEQAGAVVCVPSKASLRKMDSDGSSVSVDRKDYWEVQTPQVFPMTYLLEAYTNVPDDKLFTDDASLYEAFGYQVNIYEGSYENIKITTPEDIFVAEGILRRQTAKS